MSKIKRLKNEAAILENKLDILKRKKKFKMPGMVKRMMKGSIKKPGYVVVQYLTQKYDIKFKLCKIVQGNLIVLANKVYILNPKAIFRWRKYIVYIIKEIDRLPVSNEDYDMIKEEGRDTESDVALLKAVFGATQKPSPLEGKKNIILLIIAIIVVVGVIWFIFSQFGATPPG